MVIVYFGLLILHFVFISLMAPIPDPHRYFTTIDILLSFVVYYVVLIRIMQLTKLRDEDNGTCGFYDFVPIINVSFLYRFFMNPKRNNTSMGITNLPSIGVFLSQVYMYIVFFSDKASVWDILPPVVLVLILSLLYYHSFYGISSFLLYFAYPPTVFIALIMQLDLHMICRFIWAHSLIMSVILVKKRYEVKHYVNA